jgi:hypothetical protein
MRTAANKVGKAAMGMVRELKEVGITIDEDIVALQKPLSFSQIICCNSTNRKKVSFFN